MGFVNKPSVLVIRSVTKTEAVTSLEKSTAGHTRRITGVVYPLAGGSWNAHSERFTLRRKKGIPSPPATY
jgi:hypothetical protein